MPGPLLLQRFWAVSHLDCIRSKRADSGTKYGPNLIKIGWYWSRENSTVRPVIFFGLHQNVSPVAPRILFVYHAIPSLIIFESRVAFNIVEPCDCGFFFYFYFIYRELLAGSVPGPVVTAQRNADNARAKWTAAAPVSPFELINGIMTRKGTLRVRWERTRRNAHIFIIVVTCLGRSRCAQRIFLKES